MLWLRKRRPYRVFSPNKDSKFNFIARFIVKPPASTFLENVNGYLLCVLFALLFINTLFYSGHKILWDLCSVYWRYSQSYYLKSIHFIWVTCLVTSCSTALWEYNYPPSRFVTFQLWRAEITTTPRLMCCISSLGAPSGCKSLLQSWHTFKWCRYAYLAKSDAAFACTTYLICIIFICKLLFYL